MYSTYIYEKMKTKMAAKVTFAIEKWLFQQFLKMIMQKPEGPRPKTVIDYKMSPRQQYESHFSCSLTTDFSK
jgi:hypothetical protein